MKPFALFVIFFTFQLSLWAQDNRSGIEVCKKIGEFNRPHEIQCASLISKNDIPQAALDLAYKIALTNTFAAINALEVSINKSFDPKAGKVCEKIADKNANLAAQCAKESSGAFFFPSLTSICFEIADHDEFFALRCIETIANKISRNGAEKICQESAKTDGPETIRCLTQIVSEYFPEHETLQVSRRDLEILRLELIRARNFLRSGDFYRSDLGIGNGIYSLDIILENSSR